VLTCFKIESRFGCRASCVGLRVCWQTHLEMGRKDT
jgi:hypothetical protein